jgi:hypothetical protein
MMVEAMSFSKSISWRWWSQDAPVRKLTRGHPADMVLVHTMATACTTILTTTRTIAQVTI